ncbi:MAG: beta-ketoacyl-ACP reductase, partial [Frankiales bacterium]|nr:beta-ketoacyl-ACP reductase [Frankiales bacterium]
MTRRFEGRVALVTGAARGIGLECARTFAREGAAVALCDLSADEVRAAAASISQEHAVPALGLACDVSAEAPVDAMVEEAIGRLG